MDADAIAAVLDSNPAPEGQLVAMANMPDGPRFLGFVSPDNWGHETDCLMLANLIRADHISRAVLDGETRRFVIAH